MNVSKYSDEELELAFNEAYDRSVAKFNHIDSFEVLMRRDHSSKDVFADVTIIGFSGSPTFDEYKAGKVENSNCVNVVLTDNKKIQFELIAKDSYFVAGNDYVMVYKLM